MKEPSVLTRCHQYLAHLRGRANARIRAAAGLNTTPPPRCNDPREAYSDVYGVARVVHGDLPSMLVGGLGSLFFQMLHPHAMAGVAQHSRYQDDPLGRLLQTANFIGATTYGSKASAHEAIDRVLGVHHFVHGVADDGQPYDANDPHLLLWVHCAEIYMFLVAHRRFGAVRLSDDQADRYVEEMVPLAHDLGVLDPPHNLAELTAALVSFRPELRLSLDGEEARDFVAHRVVARRTQRFVHRLLVRSSWSLLPPWAADLLGVRTSRLYDRLVIRPGTRLVSTLMRLAVPAARQAARLSPPSTTAI
ncbi:MAG: hypothetical protein JWM55_1281 [Acidimicrobiaceae bacterium]|nr:hypothetical protein [Acidimicrobiaceae bacterium]